MLDPFRQQRAIAAADLERLLGAWRTLPLRALHRRLAAAAGAAVGDGRLPLGVRLPSERSLAGRLGVSRRTVIAAYGLLARDGLVEARRGAGHYTRRPAGADPAPFPVGAAREADVLDLAFAAPMDAPPELADALRDLDPAPLLRSHGYEPLGLATLRQAVAERFTARGAPTRSEQILITNGAQHAIRLVLAAHVGLGDRVLVESPTYPLVLDALRAQRAVAFSTRVDPREGWDLDAVERLLASERPALAVVIPDCHMPTGRSMRPADRERLVGDARAAGTILLVDETTADLGEHGPLPPVCSFGEKGVVSVGSASKTAWGGLRVGWVRADAATVQRLSQIRSAFDVAGPPLDQLVATFLLARWPEIARRRRTLAAAGRALVEEALRELLPRWTWELPDGGLCLWVRLPRGGSAALADAAATHGLRLLPGTRFASDRDLDGFLRVPCVLPAPELRGAVERLAALAGALGARA